MKFFQAPVSRIEPLETRIAPAALVTGANLLGTGHDSDGYTSIGDNSVTLIKVLAGQAQVYFDGRDITGISVAPGTKLDITGNVFGDIVANLTKDGHLTDSDHNSANGYDGGILLANSILGITTHALSSQNGDIGRIITGGAVSNLSINGQISGIYAGDGVYRAESLAATGSGSALEVDVNIGIDVNPVQPMSQTGFALLKTDAVFASGASIQNAKIQTGNGLQIFAGNGVAPGQGGGSVSNITITSAFTSDSAVPSYAIHAGDGLQGPSGGKGGSVSNITETNASGLVLVTAGQGGNGTTGAGGKGGTVSNFNGQSDSAIYTVHGGDGGSGAKGGGAGGSLSNNNFASQAPGTNLLAKGDFVGKNGGTADGLQDLLVVDTSTGQMLLERNTGNGFSVVAQTSGNFIDSQGATPDSVAVADLNGDGSLDFVVSYKNSNSIGIFLNDGQGGFTGQSLSLSGSPLFVAAGDFAGSSSVDLAVLSSSGGGTTAAVLQGDGAGNFTLLPSVTTLTAVGTATAIQTLTLGNGTKAIAIGFSSGEVETLLATRANGVPFNVVDNGTLATDAITNLDVFAGSQELLVFSAPAASVGVYNFANSGTFTLLSAPDISGLTGTLVKAQFVDSGNTLPSIGILSSNVSAAQLDVFTLDPQAFTWSDTTTLASTDLLKDFIALKTDAQSDLVALGGSLSKIYYSQSLGDFQSTAVPFSGKAIIAAAGNGGASTSTGAGGAGGSIVNLNSDASNLQIVAGFGGAGTTGNGGAGGSVSNAPTFLIGTTQFTTTLSSLDAVAVTAGEGGSSSLASGGVGGSLSGLNVKTSGGLITLQTGSGGDGGGGKGGAGGKAKGLQTLSGYSDSTTATGVSLILGAGGDATGAKGDGGAGGSLTGLQQSLVIADDQEANELSFQVFISGGAGGSSVNGNGGAGGALANLVMNEDPANSDTGTNSSIYLDIFAGSGGAGRNGGTGGSITNLQETTTLDEVSQQGGIIINHVSMVALGGVGGAGTAGKGGVGGTINNLKATGLTSYDPQAVEASQPSLVAVGGAGGAGTTLGGAGGSVIGVKSSNALGPNNSSVATTELDGALLLGGDGGAGAAKGGLGGSVSSFSVGVQEAFHNGSIDVQSGNGGASSGGIGGAGGTISKGVVASIGGNASATVDSSILTKYDGSAVVGYSILVATGSGGEGATLGGAGGSIAGIQISTPQSNAENTTFGALFVAGHGGDTAAAGKGGTGGSISGIKQGQDVNSAISLIQAGNGGSALGIGGTGTGGLGGSVTDVKSVGFIGKPSDNSVGLGAFDQGLVQGVFAGRGGTGVDAALAGSVSNVSAQQIAAIAAAVVPGGNFGIASKVSGIKAGVIGYDVNGNNLFDDGNGGQLSPASGANVAMDGFILATVIAKVSTDDNTRTAAFELTS